LLGCRVRDGLPGKVRGGCSADGCSQSLVVDASELSRELRGDGAFGGNGAGHSPFGRAFDRGKLTNSKAECPCFDPELTQACAHLIGEKRELVRPDAARDP
jgi:hypothetical protein